MVAVWFSVELPNLIVYRFLDNSKQTLPQKPNINFNILMPKSFTVGADL